MSSQKTKYHLAMLSNLLLPFRKICTVLLWKRNCVRVCLNITFKREIQRQGYSRGYFLSKVDICASQIRLDQYVWISKNADSASPARQHMLAPLKTATHTSQPTKHVFFHIFWKGSMFHQFFFRVWFLTILQQCPIWLSWDIMSFLLNNEKVSEDWSKLVSLILRFHFTE